MPNRTLGYGFQGCGPVVALSGVGLVTQGNPAPSCLARASAHKGSAPGARRRTV